MYMQILIATLLWMAPLQQAATAKKPVREWRPSHKTVLPSNGVSVPMGDWGGRPTVEARINGKGPFKLIVDTGTSVPVALSEAVVERLGLPVTGSTKDFTGARDLRLIQVDTLAIGDAVFSSVEGIQSDACGCIGNEGIVGILGLPLFQECLVTLDFPQRRVRLDPGSLPEPDGETIAYSSDEEQDYGVTVTLSLAGVPVKAHIDTGSPALVTLLNKLQKKLPLKGKPVVTGVARTPQGEAEIQTATLDGTLKLGPHEWSNPRIDFADLAPMLAVDAGNIGSQLLRDFAITMDQKNHRVRFRRSDTGSLSDDKRSAPEGRCRIGVAFHPADNGWTVSFVEPGGAGNDAGLQERDLVVSVNGKPIGDFDRSELADIFGAPKPVALAILRDGGTINATVTPRR